MGKAIVVYPDVLNPESLQQANQVVVEAFGRVDALIKGAGGNSPKATTNPEQPFFDLSPEALRFVFDLNLLGTILPSQIFGKQMAAQGEGNIINISSMNAFRPLTRIPAYSAAKAGVSNFTQWLAVHMAQEYSPKIRVNAIAPGFFLTDQNRFLLTDKASGELRTRGQKIIDHTPMGRFGSPEDLLGTLLWLLSQTILRTDAVPGPGGEVAGAGGCGMTCVGCGRELSGERLLRRAKYCGPRCRRESDRLRSSKQRFQSEARVSTSMVGALHEMLVAYDLGRRGYLVFRNVAPSGFADFVALHPETNQLCIIDVTSGAYNKSGGLNFPAKTDKHLTHVAIVISALGEIVYRPPV